MTRRGMAMAAPESNVGHVCPNTVALTLGVDARCL
jgi:hypothetical protein